MPPRILTDADEAAVIDDEMISDAFAEDGPHDTPTVKYSGPVQSAGSTGLAQMIGEATCLRLPFKNILKIDNLQGFNTLTKLCLDNNLISEITNLDHLVHLKWLDLSFNRISKIQGIETLTKLTDLSLFNNAISEVEGLEACTALECLSLGNNQIASLDGIVKLRRFKKLHLLNFMGNPVAQEGEYRPYVLAYLSTIRYLDYEMISKQDVIAAKEQLQDELLDVEEKEVLEEEKLGRETAAAQYTEKLVKANVGVVETVFSDMFADDEEHHKLKHLPGMPELVQAFSAEIETVAQQFLNSGLEIDDQKRSEREAFMRAIRELRSHFGGQSVQIIERWGQTMKRVERELSHQSVVSAAQIDPFLDELNSVIHLNLMDLETRQVENFNEIFNDFDTKYREMHAVVLEQQGVFFRAVEEAENNYSREVIALCNDLLEKNANEELDELSEEAENLLMDHDTCMTSVSGSHDVHVGKLFKLEEKAKKAEKAHLTTTLKAYEDEEYDRNRNRVMEIFKFVRKCSGTLTNLISSSEMAAEEEYEYGDGET